MTSHIKSAILTRTGSMKRASFSGIKDTMLPNIGSDGGYGSNEYIHKDFFDDENYQSILKCLDGGYDIATDLLEYMQDYFNLLQDIITRLTSYSTKWKSKLKHQSSLSSYNTTKRAQLQVVKSPEKLSQLIQTRCDAIQEVIATYKKQVDKMYPGERFGTVHKHYRTDTMKKAFKTAHSILSKASEELEQLRTKEKKAQNSLRDAKIQCQNLNLNETTSQNKLSKANDHLEKKEGELHAIQVKITRAEEQYKQEQKNYRERATEIYQQCREYEEERLDQIRQTLIKFAQAKYSSEYSDEQNTIYADLLSDLKSEQNTQKDLDFWADIYHVNISTKSISPETNENDDDDNDENVESQTTTQKTKKSEKNETVILPTIQENANQSVAETEEDQSVVHKTTTPAKSKIPKKKKTGTAEPTTPDTT